MNRFLVYLLSVALLLKIVFFILIADFENPEMYEHGAKAKNLLESGTFTMHWPYPALSEDRIEEFSKVPPYKGAWIPPLNPYILYVFFKIFGVNEVGYTFYYLFNSVLSTLAILFVYYICREFFSENISRLSAFFSLIYLPNTFAITTFSGSPLYHLLTLIIFYLLIKMFKSPNQKGMILLGVFSALLCLTRSEFVFLVGVYFVILFYILIISKKIDIAKNVKLLVLFLVTFIAVFSPWVVRNTIAFGQLTGVVTHPWHEIWRGNNTLAQGGRIGVTGKPIWLGNDSSHIKVIKRIDSIPLDNRFEIHVDAIFKEEAINYIKSEPAHALINACKRLLYLWTVDITDPRATDIRYLFFKIISFFPIVLGIIYVFMNRRENDFWILLAVIIPFAIYYSLVVTFINLESRYQVYLYSSLMPFTGIGISLIVNKFMLFKQSRK